MSYQHSDEQADPRWFAKPEGADQVGSMQVGKRLRVLILGADGGDGHFHAILATNIRRWGHEAILLAAGEGGVSQKDQRMVGDILVYDMDTCLPPVVVWEDMEEEARVPAHSVGVAQWDSWPGARLVIALSSRSVSRRSLEQVGAVALLHKPFDMRYLERYLRVFQRLLTVETEERGKGREVLGHAQKAEVDQALLAPRILVADDRREVTWAIHQCLIEQSHRRYDYEVREVHDGLELLEQCLTWHPHCVVTDLLMPWLNGYQVMRCLSDCSVQPMPAFVVISALMQHEIPVDRSYLRNQVVRYVSKPFELEALLTVIEQTLPGDRANFQGRENPGTAPGREGCVR